MSTMTRSRTERAREHFARVSQQYRGSVIDKWLSNLPEEYRSRTVEEDLAQDLWDGRLSRGSVKKLRRYLSEPTKFLLLKGPAGLGKSTLAATLGTELLVSGKVKSAHYESVPNLLPDISFNHSETDPIGRCSRPDFLVLDDVGVSTDAVTATQRRGIWSIINNRWGASFKPTIITSNLSLSETEHGLTLGEWFGEAAWDRISHDLTYVEFQGDSFRDR